MSQLITKDQVINLSAEGNESRSHLAAHLVCPKLTFVDRAGVTRTLNKHAAVQGRLKRGEITVTQALRYPWYLRFEINGRERPFNLKTAKDADALRAAKDILNGRIDNPTTWAKFQATTAARRTVKLGDLAREWIAAGLPFSKTRPRTPAAAEQIRVRLARALEFWANQPVGEAIESRHRLVEDFVVWRRKHTRPGTRYTGNRSADIELAALSSLCQWAVLCGHIEQNPFEKRDKYAVEVTHCHTKMCRHDEELHQLLTWLWHQPDHHGRHATAAAYAFSCLTGLRPGELQHLQYLTPLDKFPADFKAAAPGQIYTLPSGERRLKIHRLKRGQNPAVAIGPALAGFLDIWTTWLRTRGHLPGAKLFPGLTPDRLGDHLDQAATALQIPRLNPHGGRAYYVRVRRSQGADDTQIALELGQSSNGILIRNTYGEPMDPVGGNLHDWLPATGAPAWDHLRQSYTLMRLPYLPPYQWLKSIQPQPIQSHPTPS